MKNRFTVFILIFIHITVSSNRFTVKSKPYGK